LWVTRIDNATFKGEGYKFYEGMLAQMRQFKESPVQVLQTDIVHNEAIKHLGQEISKTRSSIEQALRSANKQLKIESDVIDNARTLLSIDGSEAEIAETRLEKFGVDCCGFSAGLLGRKSQSQRLKARTSACGVHCFRPSRYTPTL
jgi:hypothetical protein